MFDFIKDLGLSGWPAVAAIALVIFGIVVFFQGWPTLIENNYYDGRNEEDEEDEDQE